MVDTFDLSICLRALGEIGDVDYVLIAGLENELIGRQNDDGGWPSGRGRESAIELTGLAVLALSAAGARSHVPARLARAIVLSAGHRINGATAGTVEPADGGRNEALEIANRKIRDQAEVISALERQSRLAQRAGGPLLLQQELVSRGYARLSQALIFIGFGILTLGVVTIGLDVRLSTGIGSIAAFSLGAAGACLVAAYSVTRTSRAPRIAQGSQRDSDASEVMDLFLHSGNITNLRRLLQEIAAEWPAAAREELLYLLFDDFLDAPSDVAARRAEREAINLGLRGPEVEKFKSWAESVGLLSEEERRVLFRQLRRQLS